MSLTEFQSALAALYADPSLRASFYKNPSAGLKGRVLSAKELRALAGIDRDKLERFCGGLAAKKASR